MTTDAPQPADEPTPPTDEQADQPVPPAPVPSAPVPPAPEPPAPAATPAGLADSSRRNWALAAHLGAIVASIVTGLAVLGPLLVWLLKKDEDPWVGEHAKEALNFQLTWLIGTFVAGVAAFLLALVTVGVGLIVIVPVAIGLAIAWFVFVIKGAMAASNGQPYRYPMSIRMIG